VAGSADSGVDSGADGGVDSGADGGVDSGADGGSVDASVCGLTPGPIPAKGGTRLRPRVLVDEAGIAFPYGIYDTLAGAVCTPFGAKDENLVCAVNPPPYWVWAPCSDPPLDQYGPPLQVQLVDINDGLAARVYVGADGSRFPAGSFHDLDRQVRVDITPITGMEERPLLPLSVSDRPPEDSYGTTESEVCTAQPTTFFLPIDGCILTEDTRYVTVADRTFSTSPQDVTAYVCYGIEGTLFVDSFPLHALVTTEVPLESWKQATPARLGIGRYRYSGWFVGCVVAPDRLDYASPLFDTQLGDEPCWPGVAEDQVLRCLPDRGTARPGFTDAVCTQPVVVDQLVNPKAPYFNENLPSDIPNGEGRTRIWAVGPLIPGAGMRANPVYELSGSGCLPLGEPEAFGWIAYEYGTVVPPSTFGELRIEVR
jgi:hypothetical protein